MPDVIAGYRRVVRRLTLADEPEMVADLLETVSLDALARVDVQAQPMRIIGGQYALGRTIDRAIRNGRDGRDGPIVPLIAQTGGLNVMMARCRLGMTRRVALRAAHEVNYDAL